MSEEKKSTITIIMAGGLGKRMNSDIPKVLHLVREKPMIYHVIHRAFELHSTSILIVVGKYKKKIQSELMFYFCLEDYEKFIFIDQEEANGTGHAILCCLSFLKDQPLDSNVLILSGDVPLIQIETLRQIQYIPNSLLITKLENPFGCGRIILDSDGVKLKQIIEEKDCTEKERKINMVNCGIYNFTIAILLTYIPKIKNENVNGEYYLTDIVEIMRNYGIPLYFYELPKEKQIEILNINTPTDLLLVNK
jgi:bifunctional N-acetylglucosamine-1-phosphate-uridyltransferase/glucosamine-1-phosphate-acetyltransferase GlmU-like protein